MECNCKSCIGKDNKYIVNKSTKTKDKHLTIPKPLRFKNTQGPETKFNNFSIPGYRKTG